MAEAFAAVGLASSIVAFVDFAQKVVSRLDEFSNNLKDGKSALAQIQTRLPIIIDGLRRIKVGVDSGKFDDGAKAALEPIVKACHTQVEILSGILERVLPAPDASKWERRMKAIQSLTADGKIKKTSQVLAKYLDNLTYYHSVGDSRLESVVKEVFWLVPFDRNSNFVGRDSIFDRIDQGFKVSEGSQPKVALYGLGGIGKSQIALEYCFRKRQQQPTCSIFWVNAATVARFEESLQSMAKEFGLNDGGDAQKDSLMSVKIWLETNFIEPWVMIIDNADDEAAFFREKCHNDKTPSQVLPRGPHGQLLFTSRTRNVAHDLASPANPISVDFLTTEEGLDLLRKRLGPDPPDSHLIELLSELGHIPLAITQAISFIMKRRKSVEEYLKLYRTGEKSVGRLLSYEFFDHGRQEQTMESVARTWQISFNWIQANQPRAAEILCLMGFYQHHGVPKILLQSDDIDDFEFEENIAGLQAFSLLDVDVSGKIYSTHRLIQVTTKLWLEQNGPAHAEEWALRSLKQVTRSFPTDIDQSDYWDACQILLPHAGIVLEQNFKASKMESDLQKAELLTRTGYFLEWEELDPGDVTKRYKMAIDLREEHLGSDHTDTCDSIGIYVQFLAGKFSFHPPDVDNNEVAEMGQALLKHQREVLGPRHRDTIRIMGDAAKFLEKQGKFEESETMLREALSLNEEVLGHEDIQTLECSEALAIVLGHRKKFEQELEIRREFTKIRTELLGPLHRTVLSAKSYLALCLGNSGRLDEAITMGREVMTAKETVLGPDHPSTLITARNLAGFLCDARMYKEALEMLDHIFDVVNASRRVYGGPLTAQRMTELRLEIELERRESMSAIIGSSGVGEE